MLRSWLKRHAPAPTDPAAASPMTATQREARLIELGRVCNLVMNGMRVVGSIDSEHGDGIKIDGTVLGDVVVREHPDLGAGVLIVGPNGMIAGNVWARFAFVHGTINGVLTAHRSEITGTVRGGVRCVYLPLTPGDTANLGSVALLKHIEYPDREQMHSGSSSVDARREWQMNNIAIAEALSTLSDPKVAGLPTGDELGEMSYSSAASLAELIGGPARATSPATSRAGRPAPPVPLSEFGDMQVAIDQIEAMFKEDERGSR